MLSIGSFSPWRRASPYARSLSLAGFFLVLGYVSMYTTKSSLFLWFAVAGIFFALQAYKQLLHQNFDALRGIRGASGISMSGMSERSRMLLRLATTQGDFTGDDYELLRQLDDDIEAPFQGATEGQISRLPCRDFSEVDVSISRQRNEYCSICLAPYELGESVRTIPCLHRFHSKCIDSWLKQKSLCPVCKFESIIE